MALLAWSFYVWCTNILTCKQKLLEAQIQYNTSKLSSRSLGLLCQCEIEAEEIVIEYTGTTIISVPTRQEYKFLCRLECVCKVHGSCNVCRLKRAQLLITSVCVCVSTYLTDLAAAKTTSNTELDTVSQRVSGVNESVIRLDSSLASHSGEVQETLDGMEKSLGDVRDRVAAFESHPPTIGEVCVCVCVCVHCVCSYEVKTKLLLCAFTVRSYTCMCTC